MKGLFRPLEDYLRFLLGIALWAVLFLIGASIFSISKSYGAGLFEYGEAKVGATYMTLTGGDNTLGGNSSRAYGAEFEYSRGNAVFSLVGKIRGEYGLGLNNFSDSGTSRSLNFKTISGTAALGIAINLIPGKQLFWIHPYIGGAGTAGFTYLQFTDTSITLTSLNRTDTQFTYGYIAFLGVDFAFSKHAESGFYIEVQLQYNYGKLAGQNPLHIDGFRVVGGITWF